MYCIWKCIKIALHTNYLIYSLQSHFPMFSLMDFEFFFQGMNSGISVQCSIEHVSLCNMTNRNVLCYNRMRYIQLNLNMCRNTKKCYRAKHSPVFSSVSQNWAPKHIKQRETGENRKSAWRPPLMLWKNLYWSNRGLDWESGCSYCEWNWFSSLLVSPYSACMPNFVYLAGRKWKPGFKWAQ